MNPSETNGYVNLVVLIKSLGLEEYPTLTVLKRSLNMLDPLHLYASYTI